MNASCHETTLKEPPAGIEVPDADLIVRYNQAGPRYTSYPPAPYWSGEYTEADYQRALAEAGPLAEAEGHAFSLYMHLPFCERRCTFCACNVVISREHSRGGDYIDHLTQEMDLALQAMGGGAPARPRLSQMHWGGGTPTWLSASELGELCDRVAERFEMLPDREQSIEIDPRVTTPDQIDVLREHGLTRVSMGVQDFDARVQRAVNRMQSREQTEAIIRHARAVGVSGVNVDLIYGLPHQTIAGFSRTVDAVIELDVDRVALYNFAWLPSALKHHGAIKPETLPPANLRIELFRAAAARFTAAGYVMIGLDHFAKATDELTAAMGDGSLQRNFMGYTTRGGESGHAAGGLLAFGASSISRVGRDFAQNVKTTSQYRSMLTARSLPVHRGLRLSDEDLAREHIIQRLMCYGRIDFDQVKDRFGLDLLTPAAIDRLEELAADGLVELQAAGDSSAGARPGGAAAPARRRLTVLPLGRYFLRNIAMVFDAYLGRPVQAEGDRSTVQVRFSRTV